MRDTFEELMRTLKCKDVQTDELVLLPIDGLELPKGIVLGDQTSCFEILRTTVISLRGGERKNIADINSLDLNLEPQGQE